MNHPRPAGTPEIVIGMVAADGEHLRAVAMRRGRPVWLARLAPEVPADRQCARFLLEWLIGDGAAVDRKLREEVRASFAFLLIEKQEPAPWDYLCHHTTSAANLYGAQGGGVFWEWVRQGVES